MLGTDYRCVDRPKVILPKDGRIEASARADARQRVGQLGAATAALALLGWWRLGRQVVV